MPLTTDEQKITAYAYALRHDEQPGKDLWFAWDDWDLPELHRLWESGYLERRRHGRDFVYRITDQAMTAQELSKLTTGSHRTDEQQGPLSTGARVDRQHAPSAIPLGGSAQRSRARGALAHDGR